VTDLFYPLIAQNARLSGTAFFADKKLTIYYWCVKVKKNPSFNLNQGKLMIYTLFISLVLVLFFCIAIRIIQKGIANENAARTPGSHFYVRCDHCFREAIFRDMTGNHCAEHNHGS
jgi:hypothetical protein